MIGRFLTRDTIGIWGDPANLGNGYTYVGNNPWTRVDPYGLQQGYEEVDLLLSRGRASMAGTARGKASAVIDPCSPAARQGAAQTDQQVNQTLGDFGKGVGEGAETVMNITDSMTLVSGAIRISGRAAVRKLMKEAAEEGGEAAAKPGLLRRGWNWVTGRGSTHKGAPKGGPYGEVRTSNVGGNVHHTPAAQVTPYAYNKAPSVWLESADHMKTASWGRSASAQAYRQKQADLIAQGKLRQAIQMDIDDIHSKFGSKYDAHIAEMLQTHGFGN